MSHLQNRFGPKGFTVVELVVVIAAIGVLAAVSTLAFRGWQTDLAKTSVKSDLAQAAVSMKSARNFDPNGYPSQLPSDFSLSPEVAITTLISDNDEFCIEAESIRDSSVKFMISSNNTTPQPGSCSPLSDGAGDNDDTPPPAKPSVTVTNVTTSSITVTWTNVTGATSYSVRYGPKSANFLASCSSSPCTISGLKSNMLYYVGVTATNSAGSSTTTVSRWTIGSIGPPAS